MTTTAKPFNTMKKGFAAGCCIGIGTITYLLISNKLLGAFLFALGLFLICNYRLKLCTGMAGYLADQNSTISDGIIWAIIGNILGAASMFFILTLWNPSIRVLANDILERKLDNSFVELIISAFMCGALIFLAVDIYNTSKEPLFKAMSIFIAVPCFIINGFDHCIVTVFYVSSASSWHQLLMGSIVFLAVMSGNFLGSICTYYLIKKI